MKSHPVPGSRHYRSIDDGFAELVRSEGIATATKTAAETIATRARYLEEAKGYPTEKRSRYRTENRTVNIGFKHNQRVGAAVVQELESWRPMHDRILSWALANAESILK